MEGGSGEKKEESKEKLEKECLRFREVKREEGESKIWKGREREDGEG